MKRRLLAQILGGPARVALYAAVLVSCAFYLAGYGDHLLVAVFFTTIWGTGAVCLFLALALIAGWLDVEGTR